MGGSADGPASSGQVKPSCCVARGSTTITGIWCCTATTTVTPSSSTVSITLGGSRPPATGTPPRGCRGCAVTRAVDGLRRWCAGPWGTSGTSLSPMWSGAVVPTRAATLGPTGRGTSTGRITGAVAPAPFCRPHPWCTPGPTTGRPASPVTGCTSRRWALVPAARTTPSVGHGPAIGGAKGATAVS